MKIFDWIKSKLGIGQIKTDTPMKKGDKYRLIFKYWGNLSKEKADKIVDSVMSRLKNDLNVTKIIFDQPELNKVTVEGIALHDPIPILLMGGIISGIAILFGIRLVLDSVYKVMNIFTPNKIILIMALVGIPYLIFSGRVNVKGLKVKGFK